MTRKSLSDAILAHLRAHPSQPMTKSDLARQLKVPSDQRGELRKAIERSQANRALDRLRAGKIKGRSFRVRKLG